MFRASQKTYQRNILLISFSCIALFLCPRSFLIESKSLSSCEAIFLCRIVLSSVDSLRLYSIKSSQFFNTSSEAHITIFPPISTAFLASSSNFFNKTDSSFIPLSLCVTFLNSIKRTISSLYTGIFFSRSSLMILSFLSRYFV